MQTYNGCLSRSPVAKVFWTWTWRINNDLTQNLIQMRKSPVVNTQQGARCFGSNGIRTTTDNQAGLPVWLPELVYRTVWLIPGTRLTGWVNIPTQNNERSFWINKKLLSINNPLLLGSSSPLINVPQTEVTEYRYQYRSSLSSAWEICNNKNHFRCRII